MSEINQKVQFSGRTRKKTPIINEYQHSFIITIISPAKVRCVIKITGKVSPMNSCSCTKDKIISTTVYTDSRQFNRQILLYNNSIKKIRQVIFNRILCLLLFTHISNKMTLY